MVCRQYIAVSGENSSQRLSLFPQTNHSQTYVCIPISGVLSGRPPCEDFCWCVLLYFDSVSPHSETLISSPSSHIHTQTEKSLLRDPPSWGDWTHLHCIHLVSFSGRHLNTETPTLFLPLVCTISVNKILITTLSLNCCPIWSLEHLLPWVYLLNLAPFWNRIGENWNLVSYNIL